MTGVEVEIGGPPGRHHIRVGGHLLPARSARLDLAAGTRPVLTVDLPLDGDVVVTLDGTAVIPGDATRAALITMGWAPPPSPDGGTGWPGTGNRGGVR